MIWHVVEASLICMSMGKMVQIKSIKNQKPRRTLKESYPEQSVTVIENKVNGHYGEFKI